MSMVESEVEWKVWVTWILVYKMSPLDYCFCTNSVVKVWEKFGNAVYEMFRDRKHWGGDEQAESWGGNGVHPEAGWKHVSGKCEASAGASAQCDVTTLRSVLGSREACGRKCCGSGCFHSVSWENSTMLPTSLIKFSNMVMDLFHKNSYCGIFPCYRYK